ADEKGTREGSADPGAEKIRAAAHGGDIAGEVSRHDGRKQLEQQRSESPFADTGHDEARDHERVAPVVPDGRAEQRDAGGDDQKGAACDEPRADASEQPYD